MKHVIEPLLRSLEVDPSLVGDLLEQHHRGRSSLWLVRQALFAAAMACYGQWVSHRLLALRSLAVGAVAVFVLSKAAWFPMRAASRIFGLTIGNYLLESRHDTLRQAFMVYHLYDLPFVAFTCLTYGLAGWIIARTLREHHVPMVILFAFVVQVWWGYDIIQWTRGAMLVPRANLYPYMELLAFLLLTPSIAFGGASARNS